MMTTNVKKVTNETHIVFSMNKVMKYITWNMVFLTGNCCVCQNCGFCYLDSDAGPQEGSCDGVNEDSLAEYGRYEVA
jgi:hypothetical protein